MNDNLAVFTSMNNKDRDNDHYSEFLESIKSNFDKSTIRNEPLFTTNCGDLFETFLNNLPDDARQHYTCNACRHFVNRYGGLVSISEKGDMVPVLWDEKTTPAFFYKAVIAVKSAVLLSKVTGVFLSENEILGQPITGNWCHLSVTLPEEMIHSSSIKTADQMAAEKREDFKLLIAGLRDYSLDSVKTAINLLKTDSLYRSEKCLGVAVWLKNLHVNLLETKDTRKRNNMVWLAAVTAPAGFCHIKSTMIGTLLDDIVTGLSFDAVSRRFKEKMNPLQYQRPQSAPTAGNVMQAEKIVEKLGIKNSLTRRFARLDELEKIWTPLTKEDPIKKDGIFSHLVSASKKGHCNVEIPPVTMTWRKFSETVLPSARSIEFLVKSVRDQFSAILTAVDGAAPPILQWDTQEKRNPFSWYVYHNGSYCHRWNLSPGYCKVTGICYQPSMWYNDLPNQGKSIHFILDSAKDTQYKNCGNGLFPEILKSELHEIRSTIEAYSKNAILDGYEEASACGIRLQNNVNWNALLRVTMDTGIFVYKLDRWD
jgi:hypothetical protein